MLSKIEELEIRISELVKENNELREAGARLAKENIRKHFLLKQEIELGMKLFKDNVELHKELKELKKDKLVNLCKDDKKLTEISLGGDLIVEKVKALEHNKWYHSKDFTIEELKKLLPIGTAILVEKQIVYKGIDVKPPTETLTRKVVKIIRRAWSKEPLIDVGKMENKEWFKIIKED